MSIQITIDGKTKKFTNQMEAISYLANTDTQGFSKYDYDRMVKAIKLNRKAWTTVDIDKLKGLLRTK